MGCTTNFTPWAVQTLAIVSKRSCDVKRRAWYVDSRVKFEAIATSVMPPKLEAVVPSSWFSSAMSFSYGR